MFALFKISVTHYLGKTAAPASLCFSLSLLTMRSPRDNCFWLLLGSEAIKVARAASSLGSISSCQGRHTTGWEWRTVADGC